MVCAERATAEPLDERVRASPKEGIFLDGQPLEEVFKEYQNDLFGYLLRLARHRADAEDLLSHTFLSVVRSHRRYQPGTNLRAWLYRIAKNLFINLYKHRQCEKQYLESAGNFSDGYNLSVTPETLVARRQSIDLAQRAVDKLPEEYRETAWLAFFREYATTETAETLHIPRGTVSSRIYRARKLLAENEEVHEALR